MQLFDLQTQDRPTALALELSQVPRFASMVEDSTLLEVALSYGRDGEGAYIDTELKTTCTLLCQFCLGDYTYSLHAQTRFRPVFTLEAAREVPEDSEPVLYENGIINYINMIEDDALLALPNYPKCRDCEHDNNTDTFPSEFATIATLDL